MRKYILILALLLLCISAIAVASENNSKQNVVPGVSSSIGSTQHLSTSSFTLVNLTEFANKNPINPMNESIVSSLIWGKNVSINFAQFAPGTKIKTHYHSGLEEVIWVVGGSGIFNTTGKNYAITEGDLLYLPANTPSSVYASGNENLELVSVFSPPSNGSRTYI